jgi:nucleoside-diphosphate-sugar epimerase
MSAEVVVHGASGFVGGAILRALAAAPGLTPVACVRRRSAAPAGFACRVCDATDAAAVAEASRGAAFAVNAVLGDRATMLAATRNICAAALQAGSRRVVHVSTAAVYGSAEGAASEDSPLEPAGPYASAKVACEAAVRRHVEAGGEAVILRPGIVYGPGGQQWAGRLMRLLRAGRLGDLGARGDGLCNLIYHDDVGAAVVAALTAEVAPGEAINLAPHAPPTWNEVFVRLGCAIGATPVRRLTARRLRIETQVLAAPLQAAKLAAARLGLPPGALPEPIPPSLLALWRQRLRLDGTKADRLLGLARTPDDRGLAACAGWFLEASR